MRRWMILGCLGICCLTGCTATQKNEIDEIFSEENVVSDHKGAQNEEAKEELQDIEQQMSLLDSDSVVGGMIASQRYFELLEVYPIVASKEDEVLVKWDEEYPERDRIYHYICGQLQGKIDGVEYVLSYSKCDIEDTKNKEFQPGLGKILLYNKVASPNKKYYSKFEGGASSRERKENLADYDTALKEAEAFMDSLGLDGYEMTRNDVALVDEEKQGILKDYEYDEESVATATLAQNEHPLIPNGYCFQFSPVIDGVPIRANEYNVVTTESVIEDALMKNRAQQPCVSIFVDGGGIYSVSMTDQYYVEEKTATKASILNFDKADQSVRETYEKEMNDSFDIKQIKAEYRIVKYDESYAMVPVWVYYSNTFGVYETVPFSVNAVDGSV